MKNDGRFKKGHIPWNKGKYLIPWNKGLTKETDERVRENSEAVSKSLTGRKLSESHRKAIGEGVVRYHSLKPQPTPNKCLVCGKLHFNKNFCSRKCAGIYRQRNPILLSKETYSKMGRKGGKSLKRIKSFKKTINRLLSEDQEFSNRWSEKTRKAGERGYESLVRNQGIHFDGEDFPSKEELKVYKYLKFLGLSREQINHSFKVGRWQFDFFPLEQFFWEHHPIIVGGKFEDEMEPQEYANSRRKILDENGYENVQLIVTIENFYGVGCEAIVLD